MIDGIGICLLFSKSQAVSDLRTLGQDNHTAFLQEAIRQAQNCEPTQTAFCVGCVLVTHWPTLESPGILLSTGYSRELAGNTHAEANALAKARALSSTEIARLVGELQPPSVDELLKNTDVYTTMVTILKSLGVLYC